jgi:hypothetical protein
MMSTGLHGQLVAAMSWARLASADMQRYHDIEAGQEPSS